MFNEQQLIAKRKKGDSLADDLVLKIISNGNGHKIGKLFNVLNYNSDTPSDDLPKEVVEYFNDNKALPPFFDASKVKLAQDVFSLYGPEISMLLLCKSLPQCYACGKGAKVLYSTGRLMDHDDKFEILSKRLMETAQFVIDVLSPNSFKPKGKAIVTTQKVRLIHASIRYFIKESGDWDYDYYGVPINQEDMAGTLMSFSVLILEGLDQMGVKLSDQQKEAFFHVWRIVGSLNGLDEDLIPESVEEGLELGYTIFNKELLQTDEGMALTSSVVKFMQSNTPGKLFDNLPEDLIYFLLGDKVAEVVGVVKPKGCLQKILPTLFHNVFNMVNKIEDYPELLKLTGRFNRTFLQGMLTHFNDGKKVTFDIPPSLQDDWGLNN